MDDRFAGDAYLVEQLIRPIVNLYQVRPAAPDGSASGEAVAFVRQKWALKEDIRFFADEDEAQELFRLKARQVLDVGGRYDVVAPDGSPIATLQHVFGQSLFRSTWRVLDPQEQEVALAQEESMVLALLRRVQDWLPIPYNFTLSAHGRELGKVKRQFSIRDRYLLDLSGDVERRLDRRVAIALAIALDALQSR